MAIPSIKSPSRVVAVPDQHGDNFSPAVFSAAIALVALHILDVLIHADSANPAPRSLGIIAAVVVVATTVTAFVRTGPSIRGLLALGVGAAATIEGAGIAGAHAIRGTVSGADTTGLVSLTAGICLLVLGGVLLAQGLHGWWRALCVPAALVFLVYVLVPITMAVVVTHSSLGALSGRTPADAGLPYRNVDVQTSDGVQLSGWYIPSRNGAAVLTIPGGGETRDGIFDHAVVLARNGYGVLDLDTRGHGLSEGTPMDFGWFGDLDVAAGISFLSAQEDVDPSRIAALGLSMGGEEALTAAASDTRLHAVVSEGGSNRTLDDILYLAGRDPIQTVLVPMYWLWLTGADVMTPASPPMPLAQAMSQIAPRPVLLIAASEEPEATLVQHLASIAPESTELWIAPETAHTQGLATHPDEWTARVLAFLDRAIGASTE